MENENYWSTCQEIQPSAFVLHLLWLLASHFSLLDPKFLIYKLSNMNQQISEFSTSSTTLDSVRVSLWLTSVTLGELFNIFEPQILHITSCTLPHLN